MSYFTSSKSERMMTRIPQPMVKDVKDIIPRKHPCYGCKRYGEGCFRPCYRDIKCGISVEVLKCNL